VATSRPLLLALACLSSASLAMAGDSAGPPRPMRIPRSIESLGRDTKAAQEATLVPVARGNVAGKPVSSSGTGRGITEQARSADRPDSPAAVNAGQSSDDSFRAKAARFFDPKLLLTGTWTELLPGGAKQTTTESSRDLSPRPQQRADGPEANAAYGVQPADTKTGGEKSVLNRDETASVPAWAKPFMTARSLLNPDPAPENDDGAEKTVQADVRAPVPSEPLESGRDGNVEDRIPLSAPVAEAPEETPTLAIDPASFRGIHPGRSTKAEISQNWGVGEPFSLGDGGSAMSWTIEPFDRVEVAFGADDVVNSIRIKLAEPVAITDLAKQLDISDLRPVAVLDDTGAAIGQVFPERGVLFSIDPGTASATAVMLEPLDPDSFVLRAEGELATSAAFAAADLQYAIQIDPKHVRAHRLLLALMCDEGRWQSALRLAEAADSISPDDSWTTLKHAEVLMALGRTAEARGLVDGLARKPTASPLLAAQSGRLLGRIEMANEKPDYEKAVDLFTESIRKATPLLTNRSESIQALAREVVLDDYLGTAMAIAAGAWQQKNRVIPKWIARAAQVIDDLPEDHPERDRLELTLCREALAVSAGATDSIEPLPWVKRLLEVRERMGGEVSDPWRRRQIDWEVGQGLANALAASRKRGDADDMLDNCTLTAAYLERGAEHRELTAEEQWQLGDLHFCIGILHSLQRGDHATAVTWFDKAVPLWTKNPRLETEGRLGQAGESFVSMAISYWQVERREDAIELSRKGVDLMVEAVDREELEERTLSVAYGNLSTMYAEQGDRERSQAYAEMATRVENADVILR
jgi:tetratricopeptide (TPR) repeat protein